MTISENDRLDLRRAFEELFGDQRLAAIAMEAIPPLNYEQFVTKDDLRATGSELRGDMALLRGEMAEARGEVSQLRGDMSVEFGRVRSEAANNVRVMLAGQIGTAALIIGWVSAVT
jgi:hypothetical protein